MSRFPFFPPTTGHATVLRQLAPLVSGGSPQMRRKLAAVVAAFIATLGLTVAAMPSAFAATNKYCLPNPVTGPGPNGQTWMSNWCSWTSDSGFHSFATFTIWQTPPNVTTGATIEGEIQFGADALFGWHYNLYVQQCVPGNIPASCATMAALGGDGGSGGAGFLDIWTPARFNSFGHVYDACGSAQNKDTGWQVLNVCSGWIAN
jgi:hypothetical protein